MKTKKKIQKSLIALLAIVVMMLGYSVFAQSNLVISGGVATIESAGSYNIPANGITPTGQTTQRFKLNVIVEKAAPSSVKIGTNLLTNITRDYPNGYGGNISEPYADVHLPGAYGILGDGGKTGYDVSFKSDPFISIDGIASGHLSDQSGTISAESSVTINLDAIHASANRLFKDGGEIDRNKTSYSITTSGYYSLKVVSNAELQEINFSVSITPVTVPVSHVTLNKGSTSLTVGDNETLTATVNPANATDKSVSWTSSNTAIASVDANGKVTALSAGTTTITVKTNDGNKTASCNVTVTAANVAVTSVTVSPASKTLNIGETQQLTATVAPNNATDKNVNWSSSNSSVASVSSTGLVTGNAAGNATITVKTNDGNKTATSTITVNVPTVAVTGVSLNKTSTSLSIGGSETLTATVNPANATNKSVTWSSSNTAIATVSNDGKVTALSTGTTTITVTTVEGSKTASCVVTVSTESISVASVSLNQTSLNKNVGDPSVTLETTIMPTNATNQNVTWSTNNVNVATVTNGIISFVGTGNAIITVTTTDGGKTATCAVTVNALNVPVNGVLLNVMEKTLAPTETYQLVATISPANASNKNLNWTSANPNIASVDANGLVTAKAVGSAKITVTTVDGNKSDYCTIIVKTGTVSVTGLMLNKSSLMLKIGDSESLMATVTPANATNKGVVWSVLDNTIVSIINEKITAVAVGTTKVIAETQDGHYRDTCEVTVTSGTVPQPIEHSVTISSNNGGTVAPTGVQKVKEGENLIITISPDEGYVIEKITLNGIDHPLIETIVLVDIKNDYVLEILFKTDPTGNNQIDSSGLKIFSPNERIIKIIVDEMIKNVSVYSLSGAIISSIQMNNTEAVINNLPKGLYIVRVSLGNKNVTQKVLIK